MSITALTTFIEVSTSSGKVQYRYQNSQVGKKIKFRSQNYSYLSFIYQGAAKSRTGDNLEAGLIMSSNWLATGIAKKAVDNRWRVRVDTCVMTSSFTVSKTLTTEFWLCSTMAYDEATVDIVLSSAIDAVGLNAPTRVLQSSQVGSLPITGSINNI